MAEVQAPTITIEDARLIFRNFAGEERRYNEKDARNFAVVLSPETAAQLEADGWNVKTLVPREEGDEPTPFLRVTVSYKNRPPKIVLITSTSRTHLNEESVSVLDFADIKLVDLIVRGYRWEVNGKTGTSAYLQTMFITIEEDELERKYSTSDIVIQSEED